MPYVENSKCENSRFLLSSKLENKYNQFLAISSDIKQHCDRKSFFLHWCLHFESLVQRTRQSKQLLFRNALPSNWVSLNCNWPWGFIDQKKNVEPPWTICVITKFVRCHDNRRKTQLIRGFHRTFSHRNSITGIIKSAQGLLKQIKALMYFGGDDTCNGEVAFICFTIESLETIPPMASEINTECEKIVA